MVLNIVLVHIIGMMGTLDLLGRESQGADRRMRRMDEMLLALIAPIVGAPVILAVLLGHLWARERREARG